MADNIFQQAAGLAPTLTKDVQAVQAAADPLIARFKSIAAAAAAASLTHPELTTDDERARWSVDQVWHNMRGVIGFGVDILRKTDANRLVTQYVAQVIAADELAAGLQALALTAAQLSPPAPNSPPPPDPGIPGVVLTMGQAAHVRGDGVDPLSRGTQLAPAEAAPGAVTLPESTETPAAPPHEDAPPQTFPQ